LRVDTTPYVERQNQEFFISKFKTTKKHRASILGGIARR